MCESEGLRFGISISVTAVDRVRLAAITADRNAPQKHVWRASIVLLTADGLGTTEIMRRAGKSKPCVWRWRERFMQAGVDGLLRDKTRPPGKPPLPAETVRKVIDLTIGGPPADRQAQGHRLGLYVDPPVHAVMLSIDEKSQIQALDRTQPGLPMKKGRCATLTHDYKRNGTTTLFAALNVLEGKVLALHAAPSTSGVRPLPQCDRARCAGRQARPRDPGQLRYP